MEPAVPIFQEALKQCQLADPRIPVYSNYESKVFRYAAQISKHLPKQIVRPVKWEQSMNMMFNYEREEFVPQIVECGPSNGLGAMLTKINGKVGRRVKYISKT